MDTDELFMKKCLELAEKGIGNVAPNPMVGCVIVHEGNVIGEGYHEEFGGPHAEVNAINSVPSDKRHLFPQSTLYVNLEPCAHQGKTPPCADRLVHEKFARVVVGSFDPNPKVSGKGVEKLKSAGIEVTTNILKNESDFLNRRFMTFQTKHRPYIFLKWAESKDGYMAPSEPKQLWISGEESKKIVHLERSREQAILVGKNTVLVDDPELTVRLVEGNRAQAEQSSYDGKNPVRVTIDRKLEIPLDKRIFRDDSNVFVYNKIKNEIIGNIHYVKLDFSKSVVRELLEDLAKNEIQSLIVEGGPNTLSFFIEENLWDEANVFVSETLLVSGKKSPPFSGHKILVEKIGEDTHIKYLNI